MNTNDVKTSTGESRNGQGATVYRLAADDRGQTRFDWLESRHSFSFGEYFDPDRMGFHSLRVLNDDVVAPDSGFPLHPHRDAEIFTYVIEGQLAHRDSMGNGSVIRPGNLQYMSAGRGVRHSEMNPSSDEPVHLLQIWLRPNVSGGEPRYAEKPMGEAAKENSLTLLFAGAPRDGAVEIRQDADIYFGKLSAGHELTVPATETQGVWVQLIKGGLKVGDAVLNPGDGAAVTGASNLEITATEQAEFLVFVMA